MDGPRSTLIERELVVIYLKVDEVEEEEGKKEERKVGEKQTIKLLFM